LHNYAGNGISLNYVQQNGNGLPWFVDSMSVTALPYLLDPGDSVAVRVKMPLPVFSNAAILYETDSLRVTTPTGSFHVIIMVNKALLTSVTEPPAHAKIRNNYPNPFSSVTTIPLEIKQREQVTLEILDVRGVNVKTLISNMLEPGTTEVQWDGTDSRGNKLPGGIYLCRLISGNMSKIIRITYIP
jgi:hypothetical protein